MTLVYCGQTVGWIKMKLGMQVGLGPGHIVLDGDPAAPPPKWGGAPKISARLLRPNGWMDQDGTWHGRRPQPRRVLDGDPAPFPPPQKGGGGTARLPNFRPMSVVAKWLDGLRCHLVWR